VEAVRVVLDVLLSLMLIATGGGKLLGADSSHAIRDSLHVPAGRWTMIGALEIIGVIGLVVGIWRPATAVAASIGVVVLMLGAVLTRRQAGQAWSPGVRADVVVLLIAVVAVISNAHQLN
jgi:uncharacterized membrane protein YphA (DoxX/SURF4 family)